MSDTPKRKRGRERERPGPYRWAVQVFFLAIVLSAALSLASETSLSGAGAAAAALVLAVFIGLGILFDIIGVAVTAADPRPFHSMAAHKEPGAKEALVLLRNAGRVSSVCNDVVGDICGIVSGTDRPRLFPIFMCFPGSGSRWAGIRSFIWRPLPEWMRNCMKRRRWTGRVSFSVFCILTFLPSCLRQLISHR